MYWFFSDWEAIVIAKENANFHWFVFLSPHRTLKSTKIVKNLNIVRKVSGTAHCLHMALTYFLFSVSIWLIFEAWDMKLSLFRQHFWTKHWVFDYEAPNVFRSTDLLILMHWSIFVKSIIFTLLIFPKNRYFRGLSLLALTSVFCTGMIKFISLFKFLADYY